MKTALYFGSFDPIHNQHEAIINHLLEHEGMDRVMIIVSPQSPHKTGQSKFVDRWAMCKCIHNKYGNRVIDSSIEKDMPTPSYTIDTLNKLKETYDDQFFIVMGMDNFEKIRTWKDWRVIIEEYPILVISRNNSDSLFKNIFSNMVQFGVKVNYETRLVTGIPQSEISSTFIRNEIKNNKNVSPYLNEDVYRHIKFKKLYK